MKLCLITVSGASSRARRMKSNPCFINGLSGRVWSHEENRAKAVARRLRTSKADLNGGAFNSNVPLGGYKQSGTGSENIKYRVEEFLDYKSIQVQPA